MIQKTFWNILIKLLLPLIERFADLTVVEEFHINMAPHLSLQRLQTEILSQSGCVGLILGVVQVC